MLLLRNLLWYLWLILVIDQVYSAQMSLQLTLYVFEPMSSNDALTSLCVQLKINKDFALYLERYILFVLLLKLNHSKNYVGSFQT